MAWIVDKPPKENFELVGYMYRCNSSWCWFVSNYFLCFWVVSCFLILIIGAFYPWPMLYGWVYPQLIMVLIIMITYSCIAPLLLPFCLLFFVFAYIMYKYQLLFVYINDHQSGGYMWYALFDRSLISLLFASLTLLGFLSLQLKVTYYAGRIDSVS